MIYVQQMQTKNNVSFAHFLISNNNQTKVGSGDNKWLISRDKNEIQCFVVLMLNTSRPLKIFFLQHCYCYCIYLFNYRDAVTA